MDAAQSDRRRFAKLALFLIVGLGLFLVLRTWHGRAIDVELIHQFPGGDALLPADVEVQVWKGSTLHADAYYPTPDTLRELTQTVRVPPGRYLVTYDVLPTGDEPEIRFRQNLRIEDEGRYYLTYEMSDLRDHPL